MNDSPWNVIENAELTLGSYDGLWGLFIDGEIANTPGGHPIAHPSLRLMQHMRAELDGMILLDPTQIGMHSCFCTESDFFGDSRPVFTDETVRNFVYTDVSLRLCAGPERAEQQQELGPLMNLLADLDLDHPDLPQTMSGEELEEWIEHCSPSYREGFERLVKGLVVELNALSGAQIAAIVSAHSAHHSFLLGYLLCTGRCNEAEYARGVLAAECLLPKIWVEVDEYRGELRRLLADAHSLANYVRFTIGSKSALERLSALLPGWPLMPEGAQWAMAEAIAGIEAGKSGDYSGYVVLCAKALEASLKEIVFERFRAESGFRIGSIENLNVFIKENHKRVETLAKYVYRPPHHIELGGMALVLEKYGGKTASHDALLGSLCEFLNNNISDDIYSVEFSSRLKELSTIRNSAAHESAMSLDEARRVRNEVVDLLNLLLQARVGDDKA